MDDGRRKRTKKTEGDEQDTYRKGKGGGRQEGMKDTCQIQYDEEMKRWIERNHLKVVADANFTRM
jgi:hypothetical protein